MRTFCTLSDINYLLKGLTLYDSLKETEKNFKLHYLCIDNETFSRLNSLNLQNLQPWNLNDLLEKNEKLKRSKKILSYNNFCFSLAAFFSNFLLSNLQTNIYYIDSDLFFYNNIDIIEKEIGDKSIGIIRHRHIERGHYVGEYNVGLVYFKFDEFGLDCSNRWWNWVINPDNEYAKEYGTCGDQKYLELFDVFYNGKISVIDKLSSHLAPFNFHKVDWTPFQETNRKVIYQNEEQIVTFCHFMKFKPDFTLNSYQPTNEPNNQEFMKIPQVKYLYDEYFSKSKLTKTRYSL